MAILSNEHASNTDKSWSVDYYLEDQLTSTNYVLTMTLKLTFENDWIMRNHQKKTKQENINTKIGDVWEPPQRMDNS